MEPQPVSALTILWVNGVQLVHYRVLHHQSYNIIILNPGKTVLDGLVDFNIVTIHAEALFLIISNKTDVRHPHRMLS